MNLAYKYPTIFWNCACLITDSGGNLKEDDDELENTKTRSTDYNKIASAIGKMQSNGINIQLPDINKSVFTFSPNVEDSTIYFGLSGILNVGDDVINNIITNRPYSSPRDFLTKVKPNKQAMVSLIKGGAFDAMLDRKLCMAWYIWETCDKKNKLNLQNMATLLKFDLLPIDNINYRIYEFNRYLKSCCKLNTTQYKIDERSFNFLSEIEQTNLISDNVLEVKIWDKKVYQIAMDFYRDYISQNQKELLDNLNSQIFKADWDKYAKGTISAWEMEALCFYYHEHELTNVSNIYGFSDYSKMPEEPIVENSFYKGNKKINMLKLYKICGTCIAKNKAKSSISLLTTSGVVEVKFRKEYFSLFDKQISERMPDGTKKVREKSWFNRGSMLVIQGVRIGDSFLAKKYASSGGHTLYKINEVYPDGLIALQTERYKGGFEEDAN